MMLVAVGDGTVEISIIGVTPTILGFGQAISLRVHRARKGSLQNGCVIGVNPGTEPLVVRFGISREAEQLSHGRRPMGVGSVRESVESELIQPDSRGLDGLLNPLFAMTKLLGELLGLGHVHHRAAGDYGHPSAADLPEAGLCPTSDPSDATVASDDALTRVELAVAFGIVSGLDLVADAVRVPWVHAVSKALECQPLLRSEPVDLTHSRAHIDGVRKVIVLEDADLPKAHSEFA